MTKCLALRKMQTGGNLSHTVEKLTDTLLNLSGDFWNQMMMQGSTSKSIHVPNMPAFMKELETVRKDIENEVIKDYTFNDVIKKILFELFENFIFSQETKNLVHRLYNFVDRTLKNEKGETLLTYILNLKKTINKIPSDLDEKIRFLMDRGYLLEENDSREMNGIHLILLLHKESVEPMLEYIRENNVPIDEKNEMILGIYRGDTVNIENVTNVYTLLTMYQVANVYQNYVMAEVLYKKQNIDSKRYNEERGWFNMCKKGYNTKIGFYPPLWLYNIKQIKDYVIYLYNDMKNDITERSKVTKMDGRGRCGRFERYMYNGEYYCKKPNVDRYFGAKCLKKNKMSVPKKFILPKRDNLTEIRVKVTIDDVSDYAQTKDMFYNRQLQENPIKIEFLDFDTLSEVIEGEIPGEFMEHGLRTYTEIGFYDFAHHNFRTVDGKLYVIDTEMNKNCFDYDYIRECKNYLSRLYNYMYYDKRNNEFEFVIDMADLK